MMTSTQKTNRHDLQRICKNIFFESSQTFADASDVIDTNFHLWQYGKMLALTITSPYAYVNIPYAFLKGLEKVFKTDDIVIATPNASNERDDRDLFDLESYRLTLYIGSRIEIDWNRKEI